MTYSEQLDSISRTPITLVRLHLDFCSLDYGVAPCTASGSSGEECYNTFPTCQDKVNYSKRDKVYTFTDLEAPLAIEGARPYLKSVSWLTTEIKPTKITVKGRVSITLADEPDNDIGIDPYVANRSSVQGTYWKKLLARNPNYQGRQVEIYRGFYIADQWIPLYTVDGEQVVDANGDEVYVLADDPLDFAEYELRWAGVIDNIKVGNGEVRIDVIDNLQELEEIDVPPKIKIEMPAGVSADAESIPTSDVSKIPTAGYVKLDEEIVKYTGTNSATNQLTGCTRGEFGTEAVEHDEGTRVEVCVYYAPQNPFDILQGMLTNSQDFTTTANIGAAIATSRIDTDSFTTAKNYPGDEPDISALIYKPVKLSKLFYEIAQLCECSVWVSEAQEITIRRNNVPSDPYRTYTAVTDDENIVYGSGSADLNDQSRKTRVSIFWDKDPLGEDDKSEDYNAVEISIDAEAEGENEYDGIQELTIFSRWLRRSWGAYTEEQAFRKFVTNFANRMLVNRRNAQHIIEWQVELKDEGIKTGDFCKLTTDELLLPDGNPLNEAVYSVWKRDPRENTIRLSGVRIRDVRLAIIAPDATPDYTAATEAEKIYGFIADDDGEMSDGTDGYRIF